MADVTSDLLRALLTVTARTAFPVEKLAGIVQATGASEKQLTAYNMCDGNRGQAEVAKALSLDAGNFSRTVGRWIDAGIVFRLGDGRDGKLMHVYPLPKEYAKKTPPGSRRKTTGTKNAPESANAQKESSGE
jgi:hypothetical protein